MTSQRLTIRQLDNGFLAETDNCGSVFAAESGVRMLQAVRTPGEAGRAVEEWARAVEEWARAVMMTQEDIADDAGADLLARDGETITRAQAEAEGRAGPPTVRAQDSDAG